MCQKTTNDRLCFGVSVPAVLGTTSARSSITTLPALLPPMLMSKNTLNGTGSGREELCMLLLLHHPTPSSRDKYIKAT